jgi:polysaccharide deacetylase 2 family uncharacterized protein YibQ
LVGKKVQGILTGSILFLLVFNPPTKAAPHSHSDGLQHAHSAGSQHTHQQNPKRPREPVSDSQAAYISIIIDDLGHNYRRGLRALDLPAPITYSILPYSTHAKRLATVVHEYGKEVMLHLPMQNVWDLPMGPGGLTSSLDRAEFSEAIAVAVSQVPFAMGINNHMGSELTQMKEPMEWLMDDIQKRNLFFVDSRTTPNSVATKVARQKQLMTASRDIFLDNDPSTQAISEQFRKLIRLAKRRGTAIAICHPYKETLAFLETAIPQLAAEGIEIIPASNLLALQQIFDLQLAMRAEQSNVGSE